MRLDPKRRKALVARSHGLKPVVHIGRAGIRPQHLAALREHLSRTDLVKARIDADSVASAEAVARQVAAAVPCKFVARRGYVAIFCGTRESSDLSEDES